MSTLLGPERSQTIFLACGSASERAATAVANALETLDSKAIVHADLPMRRVEICPRGAGVSSSRQWPSDLASLSA